MINIQIRCKRGFKPIFGIWLIPTEAMNHVSVILGDTQKSLKHLEISELDTWFCNNMALTKS